MKAKDMTTSEKIHCAIACNEIENEFAYHCYCHGNGEQRDDGCDACVKWSKSGDYEISSAHNFGAVLGQKGIDDWTAGTFRNYDRNFAEVVKRYPEVAGMNHGRISEFVIHTLASPVIEVSADGLTAKASFSTPGFIVSTLNGDGKRFGSWMWERYGETWAYEENEWRVVHYQVAMDLAGPIDVVNYAASSYQVLQQYGGFAADMGGPDGIVIPGPTHYNYSPVQVPQRNAMYPDEYETYSSTWHYVPKPGPGQGFVKVFDGAPGDPEELMRRPPM